MQVLVSFQVHDAVMEDRVWAFFEQVDCLLLPATSAAEESSVHRPLY